MAAWFMVSHAMGSAAERTRWYLRSMKRDGWIVEQAIFPDETVKEQLQEADTYIETGMTAPITARQVVTNWIRDHLFDVGVSYNCDALEAALAQVSFDELRATERAMR